MKEYNLIKNTANPTMKTQERILHTLQQFEVPISITELARQTKLSFYQVRTSVKFLERLGILKIVVSSGNISLVSLNKLGDINAKPN